MRLLLKTLLLAFIFFLGFILLNCCVYLNRGYVETIVINKSGSAVEKVLIGVCDIVIDFGKLDDGEQVTFSFKVGAESGYTVSAMTSSGPLRQENLGYVTSGMSWEDEITIEPNSISITGRSIPNPGD